MAPRRSLRASLARGPAPDVRTAEVPAPGAEVVVHGDPPCPTAALVLEPPLDVHDGAPADPDVAVAEPELWPAVDTLPVPPLVAVFALRSAPVRIEPPPPRVVWPLAATVARGRPAHAYVVERRPTPASAFDAETLRAHLTRLVRASGAARPSDLQLVGIYERVPGGAIDAVATTPDGVAQLRVRQGARARRGTLVVGRLRSSGALVSVEA
jgi:hypothetical protein